MRWRLVGLYLLHLEVLSNVLILVNLILILPGLFDAGFRGHSLENSERMIYRYLPVYFFYSFIIIFIFPIIFGWK